MTISAETSQARYTGNATTTIFPYAFKILDAAHIEAIIADANDENQATLVLDTDFSVSGVGEDAGGNVTYPISGTPLPAGWTITISRVVPLKQLTDLQNQGGFFPETHEDALDYARMVDQQQQEQLDRAVKVSKTSGLTGDDLMASIQATLDAGLAAQAAAQAAQAAALVAQAAAEAAQADAEAAQSAAEAAAAAAAAAGIVQEVPVGAVDGVNDLFILSESPGSIDDVAVVLGGTVIRKTTGFILTTSGGLPAIQFIGRIPQIGEDVYVIIFSVAMGGGGGGGGGGTSSTIERHTVSAGEAAAKQFTLLATPADVLGVVAFIPNGIPQLAPGDFIITGGNVFDWNGKDLDGVLLAGDTVQLIYNT